MGKPPPPPSSLHTAVGGKEGMDEGDSILVGRGGGNTAFSWPCKAKRGHAEQAEEQQHKKATMSRWTDRKDS